MTTLLMRYTCSICGALEAQYKPQCAKCQHWDTLQACEPCKGPADPAAGVVASTDHVKGFAVRRVKTGIAPLDAVLSGGFVKGRSHVLAGGPGAGKSTLSLQAAYGLASGGMQVLYVCGEEGIGAVQHRAQRIGAAHKNLLLTAAVEVAALREVIGASDCGAVVFDSVQTLYDRTLRGEPGDVAQVKRVVSVLGPWCNARNLVSVFLGHVNKQGKIGGPQFFRHMTDVTLEFKVDEKTDLRELKSRKNRDGGTEAIGIFKMTAKGLVPQPSR